MGFLSNTPPATPPRRRSVSEATKGARETAPDEGLFKRNRTITGSPSSRVRGIGEQNSQLKSARVHAHELSMKRRRIGSMLAIVGSAALLLLLVILNFTATIAISVPGVAVAVNSDRYGKEIEEYLKYRPIERLRIFLKEDQLYAHVAHTYPEVESISVEGGGGLGASVFELAMRKPVASWSIEDAQYYVDARGVSFQKNYYDEPELSVADNSGVPVQAGISIASNRFLSYVGRTIALFQASGVPVQSVVIPPGTTRQIEVVPKGEGYPLKLSIDREVEPQVEDAVHAIRYIARTNKEPRYVDVRVSGKAFYR